MWMRASLYHSSLAQQELDVFFFPSTEQKAEPL